MTNPPDNSLLPVQVFEYRDFTGSAPPIWELTGVYARSPSSAKFSVRNREVDRHEENDPVPLTSRFPVRVDLVREGKRSSTSLRTGKVKGRSHRTRTKVQDAPGEGVQTK